MAQLTDAQRDIINHPFEHPGVVDAGAGTGKTFTIVERVAALHESGACPASGVLLLTFGRKAAAELRARIARRLGETAPDCQTFHGFAWSILSSHLYDIGLSPETSVIEDANARVEFRSVFDAFLRDPAAGDSGFPLRQFNRDEIRHELFGLRQRLKEQGISVEVFRARAIAAAENFMRVQYRQLRRPHKRPKRGEEYKIEAEVSDEQLAQQISEERTRVNSVAEIFARFDRRLGDRHALTYADILVHAERSLRENAALRDELRARYRCCIVDEYQDTDLAQHRFLEALFGSGLSCVMVVGDVLQSIYSFRGAQPGNVETFKRAPQARSYPLFENRRSVQEILDLAHHAVVPSHPEAHALVGERGSAAEQVVHVSSLWADPGERAPEYIPFDEARVLEAHAVALRIRQLLSAGGTVQLSGGEREPIAPRHIAILSRTKTNVQPVTDALLAEGVPFKLVGGVGFYDAPEIRDALAWLRLLADPFDSHAVARALQSSAIGATDAMLARLAQHMDRDETSFARRALVEDIAGDDELAYAAREACARMRGLLDELAPYAAFPLLGALRAVFERTGIERHYRTSSQARAPQAQANLAKLEALARGFALDTPGAQPADFVSYIDELERIDFDEREADVPSHDAVTISTIHSAKGLEWPIVFVLSVWPTVRTRPRLLIGADGALLYAEGADGSRPFHFVAVKYEADEDGIVEREDEREEDEADAEERRLFYVAITRARDRVFISGLRGRPSKQNASGKPHAFLERVYDWLSERGWAADEAIPKSAKVPLVAAVRRDHAIERVKHGEAGFITPAESVLAAPLSYSLIDTFEQCPRRATYRAIVHLPEVGGTERRRRAQRDWETPDAIEIASDDSLLASGDYGEVLHKALELWAIDKRAGARVRPAGTLIADAAAQVALSPGRSQAHMAERALEKISQAFDAWTPLLAEARFTLDFGEEGKPLLVIGYLDLLARNGDGRMCLVDYKTGEARGTHFGLQLGLYRAAARDVYGFPDVRCFVGRVKGDAFSLEPIEPVSDAELRRRITRVRDGLLARDTQPIAGAWCGTCGYRAAPCMDYQKAKRI
ncbi:MAG TPA: ATP-dependent DNA helicase [Candidatus Acidoferrales bacterium]|nr:ATP-dependent DNA helicase [Candidatus Acidoferrales bacterium]